MKKSKIFISILLIVFIVFSFCFYFTAKNEIHDIPLSFEITSGGFTEKVSCWNNGEDYYVFLPSYAEISKTKICLSTQTQVKINGVNIVDEMFCDDFELDEKYEMEYQDFLSEKSCNIIFLKSENVATAYLTTESGNMDYIHSKKGNSEAGNIKFFSVDGKLDSSEIVESIKGRGNYTWEYYDKKPYSLDLRQETDILGLGKASRWILLANAFDESHLKNKLVFEFSKNVGLEYSPDSQWVNLYANGEYVGLYLLTERNEVHSKRVDISAEESFLVSLERNDRIVAQNLPHIYTEQNQYLRIHYPTNVTESYLKGLTEHWQSVENAIISEDGIDSKSGKHWRELIDIDSWARKYLIEEIFCNGDACYISQFFYFDGNGADGKICAGPVWDYDRTMGDLEVWEFTVPNTLYANRYHVKDGYDTPWFYNLYLNEEFYDYVVKIYENEFLPELQKLFDTDIYNYGKLISKSRDIDGIRWAIDKDKENWDETFISNYMCRRIEFLNDIWLNDSQYNVIKADQGFGAFYGYFYVKDGENFISLPVFENTETEEFIGWYYVDTDEPFDIDKPIYENVEVYAKWQEKGSKKISQIIKLIPLAVIFVLFCLLSFIEIKKYRKKLVHGNG